MLQFNIPGEQYILSLDTLHFDVLRQYLFTSTEVRRPLWSAPHEESVYYQVTIASEEVTDEEAFIEPSKSYLCYICNMDVPVKYYKQHNESERHQIHKKLTGKILENVAKQINVDINTSNNYENDESYCETCCKVVAVKHKRKHKKSNYHLKSIENEQLTSKFLELYFRNENPGSDSETDNDYKSKVDNSVLDNGTNDSKTHTESKRNEYVMAQVLKNIIKSNDDVSSGPYEKDTVFRDFKIYLEEIIEIYDLPRYMPILEDNFVVIVTPNGYREYISIDNFHGYSRNGTYVFCLLCEMWVQNIMEEHAYSQKHATCLMKPVNDKFARILDGKYSHCLLCNTRVLTATDHTAKCSKYRNDTESTSASSTNHEEPSTSTEIPSVEVIPLPKKSKDNQKQQKFIAYKKQFCYLDEGSSKCLVCLVSVDKARSSIIRHVEGIPHIKKCDVLLKNNNIKQLSFERYFCKICNVNILDFINHINMHKQEKSDLVKRNGEKFILKRYVYEDPLNDDPIAKKYRQIYGEQLKRNKIVQKGESKFYCSLCFIKVTRISEIDHMFGERHMINFANHLHLK